MSDNQPPPPNTSRAQNTAEPQLTPVSASGKLYQDTFGRAFSDAHVLAHRTTPGRPQARRGISSREFFNTPDEEERDKDHSTRARPSDRLLRHSSVDSPGSLSSAQTSPKVDQHRPFHAQDATKPQDEDHADDENSPAVQPTRLFANSPLSSRTPETPPWPGKSSATTPITWNTRALGIRHDFAAAGVSASNSFLAQMVRARGTASSTLATPGSAQENDNDKVPDHALLDSDFEVTQSYDGSDEEFEEKFDGEKELSDDEAAEPDLGLHGELGTSLSGRTLIDDTEDVGEPNTNSSGKGKEVERAPPEETREAGQASPRHDDHSSRASSPSRYSQDSTPCSPQTPPSCLRHTRKGASADATKGLEATPNPSADDGPPGPLSPTGSVASVASIRKRIEFLIPTEHGSKRCAPGEDDSGEEDYGNDGGAGPSTAPLTPTPACPKAPEEPIQTRRVSRQVLSSTGSADQAVDVSQVAHVAVSPEPEHQDSLSDSVTGRGSGHGRDLPADDEPCAIAIRISFPSHINAFQQLGEVLHGLVQYWQAVIVSGGPPTPLPPDSSWELVDVFGQTWPNLWHPVIMEIMICIVWCIIGWLEFIELVYCAWARLWYGRHVQMRL